MTITEKIAFKQRLKKWGLDVIGRRIGTVNIAMEQAQEAANSEEKSSAGDKYETGRAMGHLQKDMHARQLTEWIKEQALLQGIATDYVYEDCRPGAFLKCDDIAFFISVGLGKQDVEGLTVLFLSPQAPLAKSLLGKKAGDQVLFNKVMVYIREIF